MKRKKIYLNKQIKIFQTILFRILDFSSAMLKTDLKWKYWSYN